MASSHWRFVLISLALAVGAGCGKSNSGAAPTAPTAPSAPAAPVNRNPTITNLTATPTFGVSGLTLISMSASATDPDNDTVTYQWSFNGTTASGPTASGKFTGDGPVVVQLTVADGKGGTATDSRTVTIGTMTGTWSYTTDNCGVQAGDQPAVMTLTQAGTVVSGTITFPGKWCNVTPGQPNGRLDVGSTIDDQGNFSSRLKAGDFTDSFVVAKMDETGRKVIGTETGSGFDHALFTLTKR